MRTIQVNLETRPKLFNLSRDLLDEKQKPVREIDSKTGLERTVQVYDVKSVVDKEASVDYDLVKRKSAKGIAEFRVYNDNAYIYHEIDGVKHKLAHQEVFLEYPSVTSRGEWIRVKAGMSVDSLVMAERGDAVKVDIDSETGKQTFTVMKKGFTVRCAWVVTRFNEYDGANEDLKLDFSDYKGNVEDSDWVDDARTIVFEPKGVADSLVVDPYLGVDEQSTYIDVECDGYVLTFYQANTSKNNYYVELTGSVATNGTYASVDTSTSTYYLRYAGDYSVTFIESPTKVTVVCSGVPNTGAEGAGTALIDNNSDPVTMTQRHTIYPNCLFTETQFSCGASGQYFTTSSLASRTRMAHIEFRADVTGAQAIYGGETESVGTGDKTTYNYVGVLSDQIYSICGDFGFINEGSATAKKYNSGSIGILYLTFTDGTIYDGAKHFLWRVFDVDMTSGSLLYGSVPSTARLAIGNEFTNISTDLTTTGDPVTDRNIPATIDTTSGFCADGAFHVTSDSNNAGKLTIDRDRALMGVVLEDWPAMTGDPGAPDEYLLHHFKCDSIDGSNRIYDEISETWMGAATTDMTTIGGSRGNAIQRSTSTSSKMTLPEATVPTNSFTLSFDLIPSNASSDSVYFSPQSIVDFMYGEHTGIRVVITNGEYTDGKVLFSVTYYPYTPFSKLTAATDYSLEWRFLAGDIIPISVVLDDSGFIALIIRGKIAASYQGSAFTVSAAWGNNASNVIDILGGGTEQLAIDNFKIYSAPILPYGSKTWSNFTNTLLHTDITLYSDDGSTMDEGTTSTTNIANIDNSEGSIAFMVDPATALSADEALFSAGTNFHIKWDDSDDDIVFTYGTASVRTTASITAGLNGAHWIDCRYKASGDILLIVDGIKYSASASTAPTLGSAISWSSNVGMTRKTITDDQSTPELPTVNLVPCIGPVIKTEVT